MSPKRSVDIGVVGATVSENVRRLRKSQGLTYEDVAAAAQRWSARAIRANTIGEIERGSRRVDVDDLVAIAAALGVHPNSLLFPNDASYDRVTVIGDQVVRNVRLWEWGSGRFPVQFEGDDEGAHVHEVAYFRLRSHPVGYDRRSDSTGLGNVAESLARWLSKVGEEPPPAVVPMAEQMVSEMFGIPADRVRPLSLALWGHPLNDELERRLGEAPGVGVDESQAIEILATARELQIAARREADRGDG